MTVKAAWRRFVARMEPRVFLPAAACVLAFVTAGTLFTEATRTTFRTVQDFIVGTFGWFYILAASVLLLITLWLLFSRHGRVRLGGPDATPDFSYLAWFSMLLSAGMGIGIVFFGVAEPMLHYLQPPEGEARTPQALQDAMRYTYFHWGLHPWAIYTMFALPLAYFHFRHDLPLAPRSLLYPLIGDRIFGPVGHTVDILCVVGTLFGVATSLGLGAIQVNAGLGQLFDINQGLGPQLALVGLITVAATISVVSGLDRGIRLLSQFNVALAALIFAFVLAAGPTVYLVELFIESFGQYLQRLPETSFRTAPGGEDDWHEQWTLFYWSWWISWSPFVGVFVARISRGRTLREFILTALLVPTTGSFFWFAVLGGTGLHLENSGVGDVVAAVQENEAFALFAVLGELPFSTLSYGAATLLVIVFFITSSDSGSFVDDMITSGGHPNPPRAQRVFWAVSEGAVAAILLYAGGLTALRTASLTTGLPIAVFLLVSAVGLARALRLDTRADGVPDREDLAP